MESPMKRYHDLSADVKQEVLQYATSRLFLQTILSRSGAGESWTLDLHHANEGRGKNVEPTSGLEPLTPAPATSLLALILARTGASGNQAYPWGYRHF